MEVIEAVVRQMTKDARISCPACSSSRKKKTLKTMSVTISRNGDGTLYHCFHCGISGKIAPERRYTEPFLSPVKEFQIHPNQPLYDFLKQRGIPKEIAEQYHTIGANKFFNGSGNLPAIGFVYGDPAEPSAVKYRALTKKTFTQEGAARTFYGLDQLPDELETLVIVEGELDVLSLATAGIPAISCPNGAPIKVSHYEKDPSEDVKYHFVWESKELIEKTPRIVLAVDHDEPGEALSEELARRIGRAKCWQFVWPEGCKDANDVLLQHGTETLASLVENAVPVPLVGVYSASEYDDPLDILYDQGHGHGVSTGWKSLDEIFTIAPGQLSVVTGLPGGGKSEFIDALMINLAKNEGWTFAVASFENQPHTHVAKLAEKITGKPFFSGPRERMSREELREAKKFINDHFVFLEQRDGSPIGVNNLIDRCREAILRLGCRGVVIDPFNYIELKSSDKEHASISAMLTRIASFARAFDVHVWFVAHPAKMYPGQDGKTPVPKGMSISGSAAWFAKCDLGLTVHRSGNYGDHQPEIHCWKSRFKWVGKIGMVKLNYDVPTGIFSEVDENWDFES